MKNLLCSIILSLGVISSFFGQSNPTNVFAEKEGLLIESKSAYLMDYNTNTLIYAKNENDKRPIASMTKIMTLLIAFDEIKKGNLNLNEMIDISANSASMGGSQAFLDANSKYSLSELLKSVIVASANDSSVAIAERISGSENEFVDLMNKKAEQLILKNTIFQNCTGLPKNGQYSSAKDVAIMFKELLNFQEYFEFSKIWMYDIIHKNERTTSLTNTNKLVKFYNGCDGGKTGFTSESNFCLAATAKRGATRLICVVVNNPTAKSRNSEVSDLLNLGFNNYATKLIVEKDKNLDLSIKVESGKRPYAIIAPVEDVYLFGRKNIKENIVVNFVPCEKLKAPIKINDVVGKIQVYKDNVLVKEVDVVSKENIDKNSYFDTVLDILKSWNL